MFYRKKRSLCSNCATKPIKLPGPFAFRKHIVGKHAIKLKLYFYNMQETQTQQELLM